MTLSSFRTTVHLSFLFFKKQPARYLSGQLEPSSLTAFSSVRIILISANPSSPIGPVPQPLS